MQYDRGGRGRVSISHRLMACLNPGVNVKPRSQLINKLIVTCSGMTLVLTFRIGPRTWAIMAALRPYNQRQSLTYN